MQLFVLDNQNSYRNLTYFIGPDKQGLYLCVDPFSAEAAEDFCRQHSIELSGVFCTHEHWDHLKGAKEYQGKFTQGGIDPIIKTPLEERDFFHWDQMQIHKLPGHTAHHLALEIDTSAQTYLFVGDTVFVGGVGNCKNGGDVDVLWQSIQWLRGLPDHYILCTGHDYAENNLAFARSLIKEWSLQWRGPKPLGNWSGQLTTLGDEKAHNLFFDPLNADLSAIPSWPEHEQAAFRHLRALRDQW